METETATESGSDFPGLPAAAPEGESGAQPAQEQPQRNEGAYAPRVDLSTLPDDIRGPIEARLAHVSGLQKKSEAKYQRQLDEYRALAKEQNDRLEELTNFSTGMATHLQDKAFTENETQIQDRMQKAFEAGDTAAYSKAQTELIQLGVKREMAKQQSPKAEPKQARPAPQQQEAEAVEMSPEDQVAIEAWQDERDESGNTLRPWAYNRGTPENPDRQYMRARLEIEAIKLDPRFENATVQQRMQEVDKRMGVQKRGGGQPVMGSNLTGNGAARRITLSPELEKLAVRTKFGGSKAKTDQDHIAAYRAVLEESKKKGAR